MIIKITFHQLDVHSLGIGYSLYRKSWQLNEKTGVEIQKQDSYFFNKIELSWNLREIILLGLLSDLEIPLQKTAGLFYGNLGLIIGMHNKNNLLWKNILFIAWQISNIEELETGLFLPGIISSIVFYPHQWTALSLEVVFKAGILSPRFEVEQKMKQIALSFGIELNPLIFNFSFKWKFKNFKQKVINYYHPQLGLIHGTSFKIHFWEKKKKEKQPNYYSELERHSKRSYEDIPLSLEEFTEILQLEKKHSLQNLSKEKYFKKLIPLIKNLSLKNKIIKKRK